jgi:hypothetical protein
MEDSPDDARYQEEHRRALALRPAELDLGDYRDLVIELYKKDVDRTLLRENLKLTVDDRLSKAKYFHQSIARWRGSSARMHSKPKGRGSS